MKPSSPYNFTDAQEGVATGVRIAGSGGIGDGDRPKLREETEGDGAFVLVTELKEERRDRTEEEGASLGGNIAAAVLLLLTTEAVGVGGPLLSAVVLVSRVKPVADDVAGCSAKALPPMNDDANAW